MVINDTHGRVRSILSILSHREALCVTLYYRNGLTQDQVAERVGLSRQMIGFILADALSRLQAEKNFVIDWTDTN